MGLQICGIKIPILVFKHHFFGILDANIISWNWKLKPRPQGLILPTKKVRKISGIRIRFLNFGNWDPAKKFWIWFSEIWPASCTKKSDPNFSDLSKKIWVLQIFRFILKKNWIWEFLLVESSPDRYSLRKSKWNCCLSKIGT